MSTYHTGKVPEVTKLLCVDGLTPDQVASRVVGVSRRRVYQIAKSRGLPTNPPLGKDRRREVVELVANGQYTYEQIGKLFKQAPVNVKKIVEALNKNLTNSMKREDAA